MNGLTPEEQARIQQMLKEGKSIVQAGSIIARSRGNILPEQQKQTVTQASPTGGVDPVGDLASTVSGMTKGLWEGMGGVKGASESYGAYLNKEPGYTGLKGAFRTGSEILGQVAGGMSSAFGELVVGAGKTFLPQAGEDAVSNWVSTNVAQPLSGVPQVKQMAEDWAWLKENDPATARAYNAQFGALSAALDVVTMGTVSEVTRGIASKLAREGVEATVKTATEVATPPGSVISAFTKPTGEVTAPQAIVQNIKEMLPDAQRSLQDAVERARVRRQAVIDATPEAGEYIRIATERSPDPGALANVQRRVAQVTEATPETRNAIQDVQHVLKGGDADAADNVVNTIAETMVKKISDEKDRVGQAIGEALDNLPDSTVNMRPSYNQLIQAMKDNGITYVEQTGKVIAPKLSRKQITQLELVMSETLQNGDEISARLVHDFDTKLSALQREARIDGITDIYIGVPMGGKTVNKNLYTLMRDIYRNQLDNIDPTGVTPFRELNSQYRKLSQFEDELDDTLLRGGTEMDPTVSVAQNIRRLFGQAVSKGKYKEVAQKLDAYAREFGYTGPSLETVADVKVYLEGIYAPATTRPTSFVGGIRQAVGELAGKALSGKADVYAERKAFENLLRATPSETLPSATAVPEVKAPQPTKGNQPVSSTNNTTKTGIVDKVKGAVKQFGEDMKDEKGAIYNPFFGRTQEVVPMRTFIEDHMGMSASPKAFYDAATDYLKYVNKMIKEGKLKPRDRSVAEKNLDIARRYYKQGGGINNKPDIDKAMQEAERLAGKKKELVGTPDPELRTNKEVPMKDLSGQKFTVPANTVMTPRIEGGKVYLDVNGKTYTVAKNQYENLKGQSTRAVATPFAPELEGTERVVKGKTYSVATSGAKNKYEVAQELYQKDWLDLSDAEARIVESEVARLDEIADQNFASGTKYQQYTLPGGENYTEILRTVPTNRRQFYEVYNKRGDRTATGLTKSEAEKYAQENGGEVARSMTEDSAIYTSSHFPDTPNPIYHIRVNERSFKGKNDTLFMEELQSDWAREARKASDEMLKERQMYERDLQLLKTEKDVVNREAKIKALEEKLADLKSDVPPVPSNPLLKDWQIPAVKDALMEAVDRKSKIFAWINGDQTSARYNLATYVDDVVWEKVGTTKVVTLKPKDRKEINIWVEKDGKISEQIKNNAYPDDWSGKKIDEVLGKGLADEIMKADKGNLSGDGLKFGGEWANNLYDKQVRDIVKKLTGAEVKKADMGLRLNSSDKGKWITADEWDAWYYNSSEGVTPLEKQFLKDTKDLTVGDEVAKFFENERADSYIVAEVLGDGKFSVFPKRLMSQEEMMRYLANDTKGYELMKKKGYIGEFNDYDAYGVADQITKDLDIKRYYRQELTKNAEMIDLGADKQVQQYIELTPEVVAKIQGKAPNLKLNRDITTYGIPLLMLYFSQGGNQ